ncbi:anthocyanidin 3-O-glucosyltransferase 2-like [Cynara cardunculus var. scolymus]|uniref:anthocyanidin 3-O-glucosyltransferase 2-like n=1 Tax=Cynara cardunculus var. scolymus TaxID=59895 RepID=UPI000D62A245|nr:anthocyanidin 3-O-glucosyltransferase 2-like [Cynara cardunculus var. scolymus]XP_024996069.1 anthocyanidin 3-O-glucosyltransferase 2-like [Cynara cardunculus var. scolymus]
MNFKIHEPKEMAKTVAELVFIPAPGVGHIMSTIEIAKLLVNRDQKLSITVLVIKPPPSSGSGSAITTYIESLAKKSIDRICFIELLQDETLPIRDPKAPMTFFNKFINSHCKYVRNVVADMMTQPGSTRVAGFVIDMFCLAMIDVANEFNVPTYVFFTSNAAFLGFKMYLEIFCDDQNQDVELSNLGAMIPVPSFIKPVPTKVFPSIMHTREGLDIALGLSRKLRKAKAIMVNTFLELETHAVESLSSDSSIPPVYTVGPILNLEGGAGKPLDDDVMRWLDSQPPSSVVFLCFGSMGSFEKVQVNEIAHALERSGHRFVWSLRRPPSNETPNSNPSDYEDLRVVLPEGFLERTARIGKVIGWAPQVKLLAHHAVGGFVSHCGWNSMLESLWFGVPTATWPIYAEQQMNAFEMVVELGLAVDIKMDYTGNAHFNTKAEIVTVTADEIEDGIRQLMADDTIRKKVKEMSEKSRAAVTEGGSSYASVGRLIQDFIRNVS